MPHPDSVGDRDTASAPPFTAPPGDNRRSRGGPASARMATHLRRQFGRLGAQGADKATQLADAGKERVAARLDDVADVVRSIADRSRDQYGPVVGDAIGRAATSVTSLAEALRERTVQGLAEDARRVLSTNIGPAIGTAAALGFVAARIAKGGTGDAQNSAEQAGSDPQRSLYAPSFDGAVA